MKQKIINYYNERKLQKKNMIQIKELQENIEKLEKQILPFFEEKSVQLDFSFKIFNTNDLIKTTNPDNTSVEKAEGILKNDFFLMNNLDIISFGETIDWNYKHTNSANTYRLYIQCLNVISHLCDAFVETNDKKYLYKGYSILLEWIYFIKTDNVRNKFKWVDHTVANRVMNIIYFYTLANETIEINKEIVGNILIEHGEFLEDDRNYTPNNHGVMVDRSIILLSLFMEEYSRANQWFQKGKLRISNAMYRDYSANGVHLENSPSYHLMTRRIFNEVESFLEKNKKSLGVEIKQKLAQATEYIQYMIKPNRDLPLIGDTQRGTINWGKKSYESFSDKHAGITILQSKNEVRENSTWLSFICGYGRKTHKHRDDLSITLYYKGKDILVDSGRYNYDSKDKIRQYFLSPRAHSTIYLSDKDYIIEEPSLNKNKIKTTDYVSNDVYDYVRGVNAAYQNATLSRSILFIKPDIIIIHDEIQSKDEEIVHQLFNLGPDLDVIDSSANQLTVMADGETVTFTQLLETDSIDIISGDRETPRAIISEVFGKLTDNTQAIFSKTGNEVEYLTIITLGESNNTLKNFDYDQKSKVISIEHEGNQYKLKI